MPASQGRLEHKKSVEKTPRTFMYRFDTFRLT